MPTFPVMPSPNRSNQILVVDDEPFIAQLVADMLSAEGYSVDTAANGLAALRQIDEHAYDLILSDLRMPHLDGLALYRELEWRRPELLRRMIFVSGTVEQPEYQKFLEETGVPVLPKPFDLDELRRLAAQLLSPP
ncbi:MAG TPA: response regulator [Methylomirabilota bacterium]|nr:response regulator [Methylomirabilota bacterium]